MLQQEPLLCPLWQLPEPERPQWAPAVAAWDDAKKKYTLPCGHDARSVRWTCEVCSAPHAPARREARRWRMHEWGDGELWSERHYICHAPNPHNWKHVEVMEILLCKKCGVEEAKHWAMGCGDWQ